MRYLETSIGRTGLLAMQPVLHMSHKDLWQLYIARKVSRQRYRPRLAA